VKQVEDKKSRWFRLTNWLIKKLRILNGLYLVWFPASYIFSVIHFFQDQQVVGKALAAIYLLAGLHFVLVGTITKLSESKYHHKYFESAKFGMTKEQASICWVNWWTGLACLGFSWMMFTGLLCPKFHW